MTTILQLNPPFHVWVPESEDFGLALFLIDYHVEEHLYWVCAMQKTGEIWMLSNDKVRADVNRSIGRTLSKDSWQLQDPKAAETLTWKANTGTQQQNIPKDTNRSIGSIYDKRRISEADRRTSEAQHQAINQLIRDSAPRHDYHWKRVDAPFMFDPETIRGKGPRSSKNSHRAKKKKRG